MADKSEKWLKVLGLASGATEQAIREAYRDLVKVWHPDRFGTDARLRQKADEKLRDLNAAFGHLQNDGSRSPDPSTRARSGAQSDGRSEQGTTSPTASPEPWMRGLSRMATTAILSAAIGAVGVWFLVAGHRAVDEPPRSTAPLEPPPAQGSNRAPATIERRQPAPSQPPSPVAPTTGSLRIESQPTGARVSFDGQLVGETPLVLPDVAPGQHQVSLDLDAKRYTVWSGSVVVAAGDQEKLLAVMTPRTAGR